jgi:hypothetical protein
LETAQQKAVDFWKNMTTGAREAAPPVSYLAELLRRIKELSEKATKAPLDTRVTMPGKAQPNIEEKLQEAEKEEKRVRDRVAEIQKQAALIKANYAETELEKRAKILELYREEERLLRGLAGMLEERAQMVENMLGAEEGLAAAEQLRSREDRARQDLLQAQTRMAGMGPDPSSISEQWTAALTDLRDKWGTWAVQVSTHFKDVFTTATQSISDGLTEVIMRTKSWGEALYAIGQTIRTAIVKAIVEMGVQYVMTQGLMRAASLATAAVMKALGIQQKAQNQESLAQGAAAGVGQAGAQGGWIGILIYLGVLAAALAAVMAMTGGFAAGGYTGPGRWDEPAGIVHRGEFVFSKPAVEALGLSRLESLHQEARAGRTADFGGGERPLRVVILDNRRDAERLLRDPAFRNTLIEMT